MDHSTFATRFVAAIEAFNLDDLEPMAAMIADDCTFTTSLGTMGTSRDEIIASLKQGRADGWTRHNTIGLTSAGEFVATVFRNEYADGSSFIGAGVLRLDDAGHISEFRTHEPAAIVAAAQEPGGQYSSH